ncbi:hypothetical protein [Archangium lansingense]|uniref:Uncharacterized protein n=1 Tax=Archangium lansingense TaxID=2995310 RepID=A0ABT3ZV12_9BACT|nr:hypothetical protein [Archangium lansinium]MCY1072904.1 hypothetical protein [Archangium lansinium]
MAAGCFFTATVAEARFGKSSGSSSSSSGGSRASGSSSSSSGGSRSSGSSSSGRGSGGWSSHEHGSNSGRTRVHDATPVGRGSDDSPNNGGNGGNSGGGKGPRPRRPILTPGVGWISVTGAYVPYYHRRYRPRPAAQEPDEPNHRVMMVRMGAEAGYLRKEGRTVGLNLGLEERRWGISTRFTTLMLNTDDGSEGQDRIHLADASVTFAPYASERGRLRWEAGVAMARAPDITFIGPSLALSFERCLFGPFDVEGRVQWVPLPHLQLDGQAALAMHLGALTVRAGWRGLLLDDRGYLDGVVHRDKIGGPFAGVGLHF